MHPSQNCCGKCKRITVLTCQFSVNIQGFIRALHGFPINLKGNYHFFVLISPQWSVTENG